MHIFGVIILMIINGLNLIFCIGCSGFNEETEEEDDEEGETTCTLVSRPYYPSEDESWEDDFVLQMRSISVREQERTFGPQPDPTYDAALAMLEGWDWPDPGMHLKQRQ